MTQLKLDRVSSLAALHQCGTILDPPFGLRHLQKDNNALLMKFLERNDVQQMQSQKRIHMMQLSDGDRMSRFAEASTSTQYVTFIVHQSVTEFNMLLASVRLVVQLLLNRI